MITDYEHRLTMMQTEWPAGRKVAYGEHEDQFVELYGSPESAREFIIVVHGGYFRHRIAITDMRGFSNRLSELSTFVVSIEYRRAGGSGGYPKTLADVSAAIDFALTSAEHWGVPEEARDVPIVCGHSAGGALVLTWASHQAQFGPKVRVVPMAPVSDLMREVVEERGNGAVLDYIGCRPVEDLQPFIDEDPRTRVVLIPERISINVLHGDCDGVINVHDSRVLPVPHQELVDADHFDLVDPASPHFTDVQRALFQPWKKTQHGHHQG